MASSATPYGLRPIRRADGMPYSGAVSEYLIDSGTAQNIFYGSVVHITAAGYISLVTTSGADTTTNAWPTGSSGTTGAIGVFVGCEYVNAEGQVIHNNYFPTTTSNNSTDIKCKVIDDPSVLFEAQLDGTIDQGDIGSNTHFTGAVNTTTSGSTTTGVSNMDLTATVVTDSAPFRIVACTSADLTNNATSDAFPDVLVRFNQAWHTMLVNTAL